MAVIARFNVGKVNTAHTKRLRVAHDTVVHRLRTTNNASRLVKLFDEHFNDGPPSNQEINTKKLAQKRWKKLVHVFRAKHEFQRIAGRARYLKGGFGLLRLYYEKLGLLMEVVCNSALFTMLILTCILLAGVLVGIQTYDSMKDKPILKLLDMVVIGVFCVEVLVKIISKSTRPWLYFTGKDYHWNWFDFLIVLVSLPIPYLSGLNASFLRLLRLTKITSLFKKVRKLHMIVSGLFHGFKTIGWILLLLLLIFYLFAVAAVIMFKENDAFHFGNIPIAMISLFRASTLEDWSDLMYINYFGCDDFSANYENALPSSMDHVDRSERGHNITKMRFDIIPSLNYQHVFFPAKCKQSNPMPLVSVIFFTTFIVVASFVMLSLFIGAVVNGMSESIQEQELEIKNSKLEQAKLNNKATETDIQHSLALVWKRMDPNLYHSLPLATPLQRVKRAVTHLMVAFSHRSPVSRVELKQTRERIVQSDKVAAKRRSISSRYTVSKMYGELSKICLKIESSSYFKHFVTLAIVVASVLVGLTTEKKYRKMSIMQYSENAVLLIFILEFIVKLCARGLEPLHYFYDAWNVFDFLIIVAAVVPRILAIRSFASIVYVFRLLRLLRVFKLAHQLKQLKLIVEALVAGFNSMGYITIILFIFFYIYAIIGILLFKSSDPVHFGYLHLALLTLFRCSTLDDWTDIMYINVYGCDNYGYEEYDDKCSSPKGWGYISVLYFASFILFGSFVMLSLFIGVIATAMAEAKHVAHKDDLFHRQVTSIKQNGMKDTEINLLHTLFIKLDIEKEDTLSYKELEGLFKVLCNPEYGFQLEQILKIFDEVDDGNSGVIEFPEFVTFLLKIQECLVINLKQKGLYYYRDHLVLDTILRLKSTLLVNNKALFDSHMTAFIKPYPQPNLLARVEKKMLSIQLWRNVSGDKGENVSISSHKVKPKPIKQQIKDTDDSNGDDNEALGSVSIDKEADLYDLSISKPSVSPTTISSKVPAMPPLDTFFSKEKKPYIAPIIDMEDDELNEIQKHNEGVQDKIDATVSRIADLLAMKRQLLLQNKAMGIDVSDIEKSDYETTDTPKTKVVKCLIVDDSITSRKMMKHCLITLGFESEEAENGLEAVEKCSRTYYSLVLLDNVMPKVSGVEAVMKIRELENKELSSSAAKLLALNKAAGGLGKSIEDYPHLQQYAQDQDNNQDQDLSHNQDHLDQPQQLRHEEQLIGASKGNHQVIFGVTGSALPEQVKEFREAGCDEVLTKPLNIKLFKEYLQSYSISVGKPTT